MTQPFITTLQALENAVQYPDGVVTLRYPTLGLSLKLSQQGGKVRHISSPALPTWPTFLYSKHVPARLTQQVIETAGPGPLLDAGYSAAQLQELGQERLVLALLPFINLPCIWEYQPLSKALHLRESGYLASALPSLVALSAALGPRERAFHPAQRLIANPLFTGTLTEQQQAIYGALLRESTLEQVAAELPLRWDTLCQALVELQDIGLAGGDLSARPLLETPVQGPQPPVRAGELAPDFCLPQLSGVPVRLSHYQGQKVWLIFNRQASCGFCVPRHQLLTAANAELRQRNIQVLSVWGSSVELMYSGVGQLPLPFPVMPDPTRLVFRRYHVAHKRGAVLNPRNMRHWRLVLRGVELMGIGALRLQGEGQRLPAEFLIDEAGRVVLAHYNRYATDWLQTDVVLEWGQSAPAEG